MRYSETIVELSSIDLSDYTYRITSETEIDDLVKSIQTVGLINPPILKPQKKRFTIITGFRRIKACRYLDWPSISAKILSSETDPVECTKLSISDNAFQRPLNVIEESRAYAMISNLFDDDRETAKTALSVGLSDNLALIKKIKPICEFPTPTQAGILSKTLSPSMALDLYQLPHNVALGFADLFSSLKPSLNKQREFVLLIKEIASREDILIEDVLNDASIKKILNNRDMDRNQKLRQIRSYLKKRRFPEITRAEDRFNAYLKTLHLGSGLKLTPPPYFEGLTYTLSMVFETLEELRKHRKTVDKLIQNPSLQKILNRKHFSA